MLKALSGGIKDILEMDGVRHSAKISRLLQLIAFQIGKEVSFNEITKNCRYYFLDNSIRNALINNFNLLEQRNDAGELWKNYIIMERLKRQEYVSGAASNYFWRTYTKQELDFVEEREGRLFGYEIKWGKANHLEYRKAVWGKTGHGPAGFVNRAVRTRLLRGVGAGGEKPSATRLGGFTTPRTGIRCT